MARDGGTNGQMIDIEDILYGGADAPSETTGNGDDGFASAARPAPNVITDLISNRGWHGDKTGKIVIGTGKDDELEGSQDGDLIFGLRGDDLINALDGNDRIDAGAGDDEVHGGSGDDEIFGGSGKDLLYGDDGDDTIDGYSGYDTIHGGSGNDNLNGGFGNDQVFGDDGDDNLIGFRGNDLLDGGLGTDTADFSLSRSGFTVDLNAGTATTEYDVLMGPKGWIKHGQFKWNDSHPLWGRPDVDVVTVSETDTLVDIENITGSNRDDTLIGNDQDNVIVGNKGLDTIFGNGGNDLIIGGIGNDTISGGDGDDRISTGPGVDTADGGAGIDTLIFDGDRADYEINLSSGYIRDERDGRPDGAVFFSNMEFAEFADETVDLLAIPAPSAGIDDLSLLVDFTDQPLIG